MKLNNTYAQSRGVTNRKLGGTFGNKKPRYNSLIDEQGSLGDTYEINTTNR